MSSKEDKIVRSLYAGAIGGLCGIAWPFPWSLLITIAVIAAVQLITFLWVTLVK